MAKDRLGVPFMDRLARGAVSRRIAAARGQISRQVAVAREQIDQLVARPWRLGALVAAVTGALLLALFVVGPRLSALLHKGTGPTAVPQAQGWWQRHRNEPDRYVLALPPDWRVLPLDPEAAAQNAQTLSPEEAQVLARLSDAAHERRAAGWGLWAAAAPDGPLGDATTLNVVRQPLGGPMTPERFASVSIASLQEAVGPLARLNRQWVVLTPGLALRVQADFGPTTAGGDLEFTIVQYYLVRGTDGYVVTGVARAAEGERQTRTFEAIVRSLRWTA
ncbi:MAG: hypothetical protein QME94_18740 [Anaerolineae bacterium]|nr:hypothetical protein [Anaerolineae bacterium]